MSDKSEEYEAMSELQKQIASMITQFPELTDTEIASKVINPDTGKETSKSYVSKVRKRLGITPTEAQAKDLKIEVEKEPLEVEAEASESSEGVEIAAPSPPSELPPRAEEPSLGEKPELEGLPLAKGFEIKQIGNMFAIPFRIAASRTGFKGFELTTEERNDLAEAWTPVLNEYLPEALAKYGAVVYAGYVTITVVGTKHLDYSDWKKLQKAKKEST